jgi:hypothetical protein
MDKLDAKDGGVAGHSPPALQSPLSPPLPLLSPGSTGSR